MLRGEGARAHLVSHRAPCVRLGRRLADPGMGPCLACRSWLPIRSGDLHVDMAVAAGGSHGAPGVLAGVRMWVCVCVRACVCADGDAAAAAAAISATRARRRAQERRWRFRGPPGDVKSIHAH